MCGLICAISVAIWFGIAAFLAWIAQMCWAALAASHVNFWVFFAIFGFLGLKFLFVCIVALGVVIFGDR